MIGCHRHADSGDIVILVCRLILVRLRDQSIMRLNRQEPIKVSYHPIKFDIHRQSGSRDIMLLVCRVILK